MALTFNTVGVTCTASNWEYDQPNSNGQSAATGWVRYWMSDLMWAPSALIIGTIGNLGDVGGPLNPSGQRGDNLFAMDNGFSTNWTWIVQVSICGYTFPKRAITVNFANGATQDLSTLLVSSTLVSS